MMKQASRLFTFLGLIMVVCLPFSASAETVLRSGQNISVDSSQVVDGDYYVSVGALGNTDISGAVHGDASVLAGSLVVNGDIANDLLLLTGTSEINGTVGDDVRAVAGDVRVSKDIGGDLFVFGGTLTVLSTATIHGNIYFFGGEANIQGTVDGSIYGSAEHVTVDGSVGHDVDMRVPGTLTLGDKANVTGNVSYTSTHDLNRAQASQVGGTVTKRAPTMPTTKELTRALLTPILVLLFGGLTMYLFFRQRITDLVTQLERSMVHSGIAGAAFIFTGTAAAFLLMVTVLGMILGIALLAAVTFVLAVSIILAGPVLGAFLYRAVLKRTEVSLPSVILGTIVLSLMPLIPYLGGFIFLAVILIVAGTLVRAAYAFLAHPSS